MRCREDCATKAELPGLKTSPGCDPRAYNDGSAGRERAAELAEPVEAGTNLVRGPQYAQQNSWLSTHMHLTARSGNVDRPPDDHNSGGAGGDGSPQ